MSSRFTDLPVAEAIDEKQALTSTLPAIDPSCADYKAGAKAAKAGNPRDIRRSLQWLYGWDEANN